MTAGSARPPRTRADHAEIFVHCWEGAGWAAAVVGDAAQDILQDAFLSCVSTFSRTHPEEEPTCAYFDTAVRNGIRRFLRQRQAATDRFSELQDDCSTGDDDVAAVDRREAAVSALRSMSGRARHVLVLSEYGSTNREIADLLGLSEAAVNGARYRARLAFRTAIADVDTSERPGWRLHGSKESS